MQRTGQVCTILDIPRAEFIAFESGSPQAPCSLGSHRRHAFADVDVYIISTNAGMSHLSLFSTMLLVSSRVSGLTALRSARYACGGRRFIQTPAGASSAEAYLEPAPDRPGIVSLLLNRPKAKNAISLRLLKVGESTRHVL